MSPEEIKNVINSIPSFRFEQTNATLESRPSTAKSSSRKHKSVKEDDSKVCSVCLDPLKAGV